MPINPPLALPVGIYQRTTPHTQSPHDPPDIADALLARGYAGGVFDPYQTRDDVTAEHAMSAIAYENKITSAQMMADDGLDQNMPPWAIQLRNEMNARFDRVEQRLVQIDRTSAIAHNRLSHGGSLAPFQKVPLLDNTYPEVADGYPAFTNSSELRAMTVPQLEKYYQGYYGIQSNANKKQLIAAILRKIGAPEVPPL